MEGFQSDEAHGAHDEVIGTPVFEDLASQRLVGIAGFVKVGGGYVATEAISQEKAFAFGGGDVVVVRDGLGITLLHGDDGRFFDKSAFEPATNFQFS